MRTGRGLGVMVVACVFAQLACGGGSGPGHDGSVEHAADADGGGAAPDAGNGDVAAEMTDVAPAASDLAADVSGLADASDASDATGVDASGASDTAGVDVEVDGSSGDGPGCVALSATESAAYFPFTVGARWRFRGVGTTSNIPIGPRLFERRVTGTKAFGGATAAVLEGTDTDLNGNLADDYWEVAAGGLVNHGHTETPAASFDDARKYAVPYTAIPFPIQGCETYAPFDLADVGGGKDLDQDGLPDPERVHATTTLTFEDLTGPLGTFKKALRVDTVEDISTTYSKVGGFGTSHQMTHRVDWYGAGVGPLKHTVERTGQTVAFELIAYSVGDARRGVLPASWLARDLTESDTNPYTPNRPGLGFDGTQFLVVAPTSLADNFGGTGNLQGIIVDRDGNTVSSAPLLDTGDELQTASIAWDGARYLVAYHNAGAGRVEMITVSSAGATLDGPIVLVNQRATPAVVATSAGFLVSYTQSSTEAGTGKTLYNVWLAVVDAHAHPTSRVEPFPTSLQGGALLAKDGADGVMALLTTPSPTAAPANILAAARLTADGHGVDAAPFAIESAPVVADAPADFIFDGTSFVASWSQASASTVHLHVARISPSGALLDGPATGGGVDVGGGAGGARLGRLGTGSLFVWVTSLAGDPFIQGIWGTRLTMDGKALDVPGDDGGRWLLTDFGVGDNSLPEILWGGDRALVVWTNQAEPTTPTTRNDVFSIGSAIAYPW